MCRFGVAHRKSTIIASNMPGLEVVGKTCLCEVQHEVLKGVVVLPTPSGSKRIWKTSLASKYPPSLCKQFAAAAALIAPRSAWRSSAEPQLNEWWERSLARRTNAGIEKTIAIPRNPRRFTTGWQHTVDSWGCGPSPQQRREALSARGGRYPAQRRSGNNASTTATPATTRSSDRGPRAGRLLAPKVGERSNARPVRKGDEINSMCGSTGTGSQCAQKTSGTRG